MRRVYINGSPPADWVTDAETATQQLRAAADENARDAIIEANKHIWIDDRIRNWLLGQFNNKCWYSEAQDAVSSIHVDHYRPKCRLKQELGAPTQEGYWWLAFRWENYRICGQLLNVKKGDLFPVVGTYRCVASDETSIQLESPHLIDPLTDEARLVSYEKDEDACIAVPAGAVSAPDRIRAEKTIEILGLNLRPRLNQKRNEFWDRCMMKILEYQNASGAQPLRVLSQASAKKALKEMVQYDAEFSSIVEACLHKNAPLSLKVAVLENAPEKEPTFNQVLSDDAGAEPIAAEGP